MSLPACTETREDLLLVASELLSRFPELDLRFNLMNGRSSLRFMVASISRDVIELDSDGRDQDELLHAAILEVKALARLFDD